MCSLDSHLNEFICSDVDVKKLVSLYHHHYDLVGKVTVLRKERNTLADRLSSANVTDRAALVEKVPHLFFRISSCPSHIIIISVFVRRVRK